MQSNGNSILARHNRSDTRWCLSMDSFQHMTIRLLYLFAYLTAFSCVLYFVLNLSGVLVSILKHETSTLSLVIYCLVAPATVLYVMGLRNKFDLLTMSDGTSLPSRIIFLLLGFFTNCILIIGLIDAVKWE